jgi:hypothetical protein
LVGSGVGIIVKPSTMEVVLLLALVLVVVLVPPYLVPMVPISTNVSDRP